MQDVVNMINTVGFPIACVIACGYFIYKTNQQNRQDNKDREDKMYKQLDKFENFPVFKEKATEVIEKLEKQIIEAKEKVVEPVKQTIQDYREEKIIAYEDGLQEYKKLMEKEAKLDIQGINEEIKSFMEVLNGIEENNDSSEESEGNQND